MKFVLLFIFCGNVLLQRDLLETSNPQAQQLTPNSEQIFEEQKQYQSSNITVSATTAVSVKAVAVANVSQGDIAITDVPPVAPGTPVWQKCIYSQNSLKPKARRWFKHPSNNGQCQKKWSYEWDGFPSEGECKDNCF